MPSREPVKPLNRVQHVALWLAYVFGITSLILVIYWATKDEVENGYLGGVDWNDNIANWHPIFMYLFILCFTFSILSYRSLPFGKKINKKIHWLFQTCSIVFITLGLYTMFKNHNDTNKPNLYTFHSWLGIMTVTLFIAQYIVGIYNYLLQLSSLDTRKSFLQFHVFLGLFIYFSCAMTASAGITEKSNWNGCTYTVSSPDYNPAEHYHLLPNGCKLGYGFGFCAWATTLFATLAAMDLRAGSSTDLKEKKSTNRRSINNISEPLIGKRSEI